MAERELAALLLGLAGLVGGLLGPAVIARIPEPEPPDPADGGAPGADPATPAKEPYRQIAARPRLGVWLALIGALTGGLVGAAIGWRPELLPWVWIVPVGVILGLVDWRTRLLPRRVVVPSYAAVAVLLVAASALAGDPHLLLRAVLGWALMGGLYLLLWLVHPAGMGYGDVRLSGVLGLALGALGVAQVVVGAWFGFLLGGVGGLLLNAVTRTGRRSYPQGPFMVAGAVLGVLLGPAAGAGLGY